MNCIQKIPSPSGRGLTTFIDTGTSRLIYGWLAFAISSLVFAGMFAFLVVMARTPVILELFPGSDYVRVALVGHVVLSFVIWFLAFKGLLWTLTSTVMLDARQYSIKAGWSGLILSIFGTILVIASAVFGLGKPQFVNYVPVLSHPVFYSGLILLFSGITVTVVNTLLTIFKAWRGKSYRGSFPVLTFGMLVAGIAVLSAFACFGLSWYFQTSGTDANAVLDLESLFWGGGHILQFANTIALVTAWLFLTIIVFRNFPLKDVYAKILFGIYLIFILPAPVFYFIYDISSHEYKNAFTAIMKYGLGPSTGVFALAILIAISSKGIKQLPWNKPEFSSLVLSMFLFALGGAISFTIGGYNTKIPSHYHGVIGGVTLAFMGLTNYILGILNREVYRKRIASLYPYVYGIGQTLFVIGMFWAGSHGVARKTFGAEQNLNSTVKIIGMAIVGIGGLIAIAGGILFIIHSSGTLLQNGRQLRVETREDIELALQGPAGLTIQD